MMNNFNNPPGAWEIKNIGAKSFKSAGLAIFDSNSSVQLAWGRRRFVFAANHPNFFSIS